ncbi:hypothetical protein EMPS_08987 [Entomortierella parvispora]|uniref:Uncharacterized protein n=1 Tax=Entomortierella parvispora TaxID=205924 RepID=A0A9P3LZW2_9FUNG|nr:hypothetical protein EMPS_08987 [Entomortierella parvispora]
MLHITPISRPDRFLNEEMPFVNTTGSMNFSLTSPGQLHLEPYQKALKSLILVLQAIHEKNSLASQKKHHNANPAEESVTAATENKSTTLEVSFRSGGVFVLDLSVTEPGFGGSSSSSNPSPSQAYPLTFLSTSLSTSPTEVGAGGNGDHGVVLYFLRLPLNPVTHPIQCQLSARRLHAQHVTVLDRILRRLCDASPGAFMVGYSDGISGVDAGKEVVYSGENSPLHLLDQQQPQQQQPQSHQHTHNSLEKSIAQARDHGNMDIDSRVAALVGHVEHPSAATITQAPPSSKSTKTMVAVAVAEVEDVVSSLDVGMTSATLTKTTLLATMATATTTPKTTAVTSEDQEQKAFHEKLLAADRFIANHDFGMVDDIEQLLDVHGSVDLDSVHDILWVNS